MCLDLLSWLINDNSILIIAGLISAISTILLVPFVQKIGFKYQIIDDPDPRKMHTKPTVRLGGLALIVSFLFTLYVIYTFINNGDFPDLNIDNYISIILVSSSISFIVGILDDIYTSPYWLRLIAQILISILIWKSGIRINIIDVSFLPFISENYVNLNDFLSLVFNILWFCGITNSINWMDGLDGLASGITSIIAIGLLMISIVNGNFSMTLLSIILAGSCLGFLKNNSYPSRIMMGDCGSYFLGSMLAVMSIVAMTGMNQEINLLVPFTLFLVPIADMSYVIISRIFNGLSPFYPDRRHLHHRLIKLGFSYKKTVYIIYFLNLVAVILSFKIFQLSLEIA